MARREILESSLTCVALALALLLISPLALNGQTTSPDNGEAADAPASEKAKEVKLEKATFGAGCFWCTEAVFARLEGVESVESGFSGGPLKNPTYKQVLTGRTGHAEVVQVTFDPEKISYKDLLEVFWKTHDPTTLNRQGPDRGTQYRSVVFYHSEEQKELATHYKQRINEVKMFLRPVVTEISPFEAFYAAEGYHQDFYELNPRYGYCTRYIRPKLEKFEKVFAEKLKKEPEGLERIRKTSSQWRSQLSTLQYNVARMKGTERAFTGKYWNHKEEGSYQCICCELPLFESSTKFKSGTGWPSFFAPADGKHIAQEIDRSMNQVRMEVKCARCDAHLGHVFNDGPAPTGLRYCINSASLRFDGSKE